MLRIGELAERSGVSVRSLRYYEEQCMLESERTSGGQRVYPPEAVDRVRLIQQLFSAGIPSRVIVELLPCVTQGLVTAGMLERIEAERDALAQRIEELADVQQRLDEVARSMRDAATATAA